MPIVELGAIPLGLCQCGCGGKTSIATQWDRFRRFGPGDPKLLIVGHKAKRQPKEAMPFKIDGVYCRLVPLSRGLHTIVEEADYLPIMRTNWYARWDRHTRSFYAGRTAKVDGKEVTILMHRQIASADNDKLVDHRNHCGLDNRRKNLRQCSNQQNVTNGRIRARNKTGYIGVSRRKSGMYRVQITVGYRKIRLGQYSDPAAAAKVYDAAAIQHHGEFAALNFPQDHAM